MLGKARDPNFQIVGLVALSSLIALKIVVLNQARIGWNNDYKLLSVRRLICRSVASARFGRF